MAIWDQVKSRTQNLTDQLQTKKGQFRNKEFAEASMAMCALIAAADGSIDASERQRTAALITSNELLSVFPPDDLRAKFDGYCDKLTRDFDFGKVDALAAIGKLRTKPEQARAVVSIGLIIGGADGNLDADERRTITQACAALDLAPEQFQL